MLPVAGDGGALAAAATTTTILSCLTLPKVHWRDKRMMTDEYFFTRRDNANHFVIGDGRMTGGPCQSELEQTGLRKV